MKHAIEEAVAITRERGLPRRCPTCDEPVDLANLDRPAFLLGRVSAGRPGPLAELDHLVFHAHCVRLWPRWGELVQDLEEARTRGEWEGPLPILEPYAHWPGDPLIDPSKVEHIDDD